MTFRQTETRVAPTKQLSQLGPWKSWNLGQVFSSVLLVSLEADADTYYYTYTNRTHIQANRLNVYLDECT